MTRKCGFYVVYVKEIGRTFGDRRVEVFMLELTYYVHSYITINENEKKRNKQNAKDKKAITYYRHSLLFLLVL